MRNMRWRRRRCACRSKEYDLVEAAAVPETFFTVWTNRSIGRMQGRRYRPGPWRHQRHWTTAIQLAAVWGAKVYATAGSADKARFCERLGAVRGIDYHSEDFVAWYARQRGPGVDLILDIVGANYLARNFEAARSRDASS